MKIQFILLLIIPLLSFSNCHQKDPKELVYNNIDTYTTALPSAVKHTQWQVLLSKHVSKDGKVNYDGFKADEKALQTYLDLLQNNAPAATWSKNEKLAYWINAYNAFTVKLILDYYPVKSIKDINDPWGKAFINIEGKSYSLEAIEHEILRKMNEPRIHFAINCASYSCPDLLNVAYTAEHLDQQLETAAKHFVNDNSKNSISKDSVEISKIFKWFSGDFEEQGTIIDFLNRYSKVKIDGNAKIRYKNYNWDLNS